MNLPKNWIQATLGSAVTWSSGGTPKRDILEYYGGDIPWVVIGDLNESLIFETGSTITQIGLENSSAKWVQPGAVLLAMYGSVGKASIAGCWLTTNQAIAFTEGLDSIDGKYLYYYIKAKQRDLVEQGKGATQQNISQTILKNFPFVIAPRRERVAITAKLDEIFSELDAAVAGLNRIKTNLKRYRASVLQAAVEGRLTAEWRRHHPPSETGEQLLARILKERRAKWEENQLKKYAEQGRTPPKNWQDKYPEPVKPDTTGLPELPEGWVWSQLDVLASIKGGITVDSNRKDNTARTVPYLRVANVQRGYLDLSTVKYIKASEADIYELRLKHGDILFNEGGDRDKLGRGWIWEDQLDECIHQNHVFRARPYISDLSSKFISWWGNTFGKDYFLREGKQTTNLASINLKKLAALPVPITSACEQSRIVSEVESRLSIADAAENTIDSALRRAAQLRQSILKRAFEGRLVPQDPNDEPASMLLERIRAERLNQAATVKPARTKRKGKDQQAETSTGDNGTKGAETA